MRDQFCNSCGTQFPDATKYPRTCAKCGIQVWANPIPVSVVIVPIIDTAPPSGGAAGQGNPGRRDGSRLGVLAIKRGIPPGVGMLALVGGFLEEHETWQAGGAREVMEETNIVIDPKTVQPLWWESSSPKPNRVLLFGVSAPLKLAELPPFQPNHETQARGVVWGPEGIETDFVFSTHIEATKMYFAREGITGPHAFSIHQ